MIRQYHDKPSFKLRGKSKSEIFFGIELEVQARKGHNHIELSNEVDACLGNFAICKHDNTCGLNGFEICSSPASLDYHRTAWDNFFYDIAPNLRGFRTEGCGMHVHVSRAPLSLLQIGKILIFIYNQNNHKFITRISQRESHYHNNFNEIRHFGDAKKLNPDKHTAVNLRNSSTIEIRLFKSNLKKEMFLKNIEFCHALIKFTWAGQASLTDCTNWKSFVRFVKQNKDTYPNLFNFLVQYHYAFQKRNPFAAEHELIGDRNTIIDFEDRIKEKVENTFEAETIKDWNQRIQDLRYLYNDVNFDSKEKMLNFLETKYQTKPEFLSDLKSALNKR